MARRSGGRGIGNAATRARSCGNSAGTDERAGVLVAVSPFAAAQPLGQRAGPEPVEVPADWAVLERVVPAAAWRTGVNDRGADFDRATRPSDVGQGSDTRLLAAAVDYVRMSSKDPEVRILYVRTDQRVPGTLGGSVHVQAVAEGLAALGHDVHVRSRRGATGLVPMGAVHWHAMRPAGRPCAASPAAFARGTAACAERYGRTSSSSGTTTSAARACWRRTAVGARFVLEVNAPVIDYPGSPKAALDRALLAQPMRRWRDWQVSQADLIVTPSASDPARRRAGRSRAGDRMGRGHDAVSSRRDRRGAVGPRSGHDRRGVRRRLPRVAWRHPARRGRRAAARAAADAQYQAVLIGDGPERGGCRAGRARRTRHHVCRTRRARPRCRRRSPPPTSASRRSTSAGIRRLRSASTGRR